MLNGAKLGLFASRRVISKSEIIVLQHGETKQLFATLRIEPRKGSRGTPGRVNIHVLQADVTDYSALEAEAADTTKITGGSLDYLVANAAFISRFDSFEPLGGLYGTNPQALEANLLQYFKTNTFVPLVQTGKAKKVIALSSGHADLEMVRNYNISKAVLNMVVGKDSAQYAKEGSSS
ncbi:hypothetical protein BJX99DRAFT_263454 [Aspergillus californicus]